MGLACTKHSDQKQTTGAMLLLHVYLDLNAWLGWPIPRLPHAGPRHRQEPQLACAWRAFASLHATSSTRGWSWGARLPFLQSPMTQIPDIDLPHSLYNTQQTSLRALLCFLAFADKNLSFRLGRDCNRRGARITRLPARVVAHLPIPGTLQ